VASRKNAENKPEPDITDAAEKARALIQELQSRLRAETGTQGRDQPDEARENLEKQLEAYFQKSGATRAADPSQAGVLDDIRGRVIEGVVERILREWERPEKSGVTPLQNAVVERLIDRVLERLGKGSA
jgi:hypothetical protein